MDINQHYFWRLYFLYHRAHLTKLKGKREFYRALDHLVKKVVYPINLSS
jgi:predicted solute-binding protein